MNRKARAAPSRHMGYRMAIMADVHRSHFFARGGGVEWAFSRAGGNRSPSTSYELRRSSIPRSVSIAVLLSFGNGNRFLQRPSAPPFIGRARLNRLLRRRLVHHPPGVVLWRGATAFES